MQISEIFNLFDTDGGGTIDRGEIDFAMNALGFHSKHGHSKTNTKDNYVAQEAINEIAADGYVMG